MPWCEAARLHGAFAAHRSGSTALKPNGKVDHSALPEEDYADFQADYIAPQSVTEKRVAAIWAEVLRLDRVGRHDNFFALGGHSLLPLRSSAG